MLTDEAQRTVYYERGGGRPMQGTFRIRHGLDEEHVRLVGGMMEGEYRRYRDGVLREAGLYADGRRTGIFTEYYQDGRTPRRVAPMRQGRIDGTVKTFFRNGSRETEKEYRQGVEHGVERRFDGKTGEQVYEARYADGRKEGEEWTINDDGRGARSMVTRHYRGGKADGSYRLVSTLNGRPYITVEGQYSGGRKSGHWRQHDAIRDTMREWDE